MNFEHGSLQQHEQEDTKILLQEQFSAIFDEYTSSSITETVLKRVETLLESDPKFLEAVLSSTKDLREISETILNRIREQLKKNNIEVVFNDQYGHGNISTREGIRDGKFHAPDLFSDPMGYESFMKAQNEKTPYSGLDDDQKKVMFSARMEMYDVMRYNLDTKVFIETMLREKTIAEENKNEFPTSTAFLEQISIPLTQLHAHISGKLAKLKYAPMLTADAVSAFSKKLFSLFEKDDTSNNS